MGRLAPGVVVVPRAPVSRWTRLYEDFVGFDRLKRLQNQIREVAPRTVYLRVLDYLCGAVN